MASLAERWYERLKFANEHDLKMFEEMFKENYFNAKGQLGNATAGIEAVARIRKERNEAS